MKDLLSIFTSVHLIGVLKIHFEHKSTLKTFIISLGKPFFSIYLLENLISCLVIVMQVLIGWQIRNAP